MGRWLISFVLLLGCGPKAPPVLVEAPRALGVETRPERAAHAAFVRVYSGLRGPVGGLVHCCPDPYTSTSCPSQPERPGWLLGSDQVLELGESFEDPGAPGLWHLRLDSGRWWTVAVHAESGETLLVVRPLPHQGAAGVVVPQGWPVELGRPGLPHQAPVPVTEWSPEDISTARCLAEAVGADGVDRFVAELGAASGERDALRRGVEARDP